MINRVRNLLQSMERRKQNNRGAAIVIVIVAVALLCLFVSLLLTLSYYNFRMKTTDLNAKKTFYTAETALDEIRAGLRQDVSESFSQAYVKTMESYVDTLATDREAQFRIDYLTKLHNRLQRDALHNTQYSVARLESYLKKTAWNAEAQTGAQIVSGDSVNVLTTRTDGLVLEGVTVTYKDKKGYVSEIQTDIVLKVPDMGFLSEAGALDCIDYALIANDKLEVSGSGITAKGSAYIGKNGADIGVNTPVSFGWLSSAGENRIVSNGRISVERNAGLQVDNMELWAKDLVVDCGNISIQNNSSTYLSNDLVLNNSSSGKLSTRVSISGRYYGFGSVDTAKDSGVTDLKDIDENPSRYSSAILINGVRSGLDLSGLNELMLAGNSYIAASEQNDAAGTGAVSGTSIKNTDIAMGESLSVKSDQTAYIIPPSCVAGGINPMPAENFRKLEGSLVDYNIPLAEYGGQTLAGLGVIGYDTVAYPVDKLGSMVYLFMKFDSEASASRFFQLYAGNNTAKLKGKLDTYAEYGIKVPAGMKDDTDVNTFYYNGSVVVKQSEEALSGEVYMSKLQQAAGVSRNILEDKQKLLQKSLTALGRNLTTDYDPRRTGDVYSNLIVDFSALTGKMKFAPGKTEKLFATEGVSPVAAMVVEGDKVIDDTQVYVSGEAAQLRVVIASGDVTVDTDFTGMIIAGGTVRVKTTGMPVSLTAAPADVLVALNAVNADGITALMYLKEFAPASAGGEGLSSGGGQSVSIQNLVVFERWKKQ